MKKRECLVRGERGFTLVEIIAVVVLIGLIMGVLIKGINTSNKAAQAGLNKTRMEKVTGALEQYRNTHDSGKYPPSLEALVKSEGNWVATIDKAEILDVWKNPLEYKAENNGRAYALKTLGYDGVPGGEGADADVVVRGRELCRKG